MESPTVTAALLALAIGLVEVIKLLAARLMNGRANGRNGASHHSAPDRLVFDRTLLVLEKISDAQERLLDRLEADRAHLDARLDRVEDRILSAKE